MPATQIERPFRLKSTLGDDALLLESFTGYERVSTPFRYLLHVLSPDANIAMKDLLTKPLVLSYDMPDDKSRHTHGLISRMKLLEVGEDGLAAYEIEMVPWLWFLHQFHDCRIFQNKSVTDIIETVFKDRGFTDFEINTQGSYSPRDYCVQYRETDFNFISRLMEEEGIFYFFKQDESKHTLVLGDAVSTFAACALMPKARYTPATGGRLDEDTVAQIEHEYRVNTGKTSLTDYDFEKPNTSLMATLSGGGEGADQEGEYYDYPGKHKTKAEGDRYVRIRLEEREVNIQTVRGLSNCMGFECGYKFTLEEHFRDEANQDYTLLALEHRGKNTSYRSGRSEEPFEYTNRFEAIPNAVPFRPPRLARKPAIHGTQTAVVVGKSGEEIFTDKYGRVKVQFFWDRQGLMDENSSCWIRVAQGWAGKGWGIIHIPRMGQEVVVSFLEGDPDRPLITGSVYNADQEVPYALPGEHTKSTLKSMSSKGGGGFNEIRFEDKKDNEEVFIHAQKDLDIRVVKDRLEWIGQDRHLMVVRDKLEDVQRDSHVNIARDQVEKFGRDHHLEIAGKEAIKITGSHSLDVTGDVIEEFKANHSSQVTQNLYLKAMQVVIEAATGLTLKVGSNFITIDMSGIAIKGMPMVQINSAGAALSGSPGSLVSPISPTAPTEAVKADPGKTTTPGSSSAYTPTNMAPETLAAGAGAPPRKKSAASNAPTHNPAAAENQDKTHWIEIELLDEEGKPITGEPYKITLPSGKVADGTTDSKGRAKIPNIDAGQCKVTFPNLDKDAWGPA